MKELRVVNEQGMAEVLGARKIWAAVLLRAVEDAAGCVVGVGSAMERERTIAGARAWLRSDSARPGGFCWVCDMLGLDAAKIRREAAQYVSARGPRTRIRPRGFGAVVRAFRVRRGWTMARLAELLDVSPSTICNIEAGRHKKTARIREKMYAFMRTVEEGS